MQWVCDVNTALRICQKAQIPTKPTSHGTMAEIVGELLAAPARSPLRHPPPYLSAYVLAGWRAPRARLPSCISLYLPIHPPHMSNLAANPPACLSAPSPTHPLAYLPCCLSSHLRINPGCLSSHLRINPGCLLTRLRINPGCLSSRQRINAGCLLTRLRINPGCLSSHLRINPGCLLTRLRINPDCRSSHLRINPGCLSTRLHIDPGCLSSRLCINLGCLSGPLRVSQPCLPIARLRIDHGCHHIRLRITGQARPWCNTRHVVLLQLVGFVAK